MLDALAEQVVGVRVGEQAAAMDLRGQPAHRVVAAGLVLAELVPQDPGVAVHVVEGAEDAAVGMEFGGDQGLAAAIAGAGEQEPRGQIAVGVADADQPAAAS